MGEKTAIGGYTKIADCSFKVRNSSQRQKQAKKVKLIDIFADNMVYYTVD